MSPMKVMPLLLTGIAPFVMVSGTARAAEPQIILAQAQTPQQQEDEKEKKRSSNSSSNNKTTARSTAACPATSSSSRITPKARSLRRSNSSVSNSKNRLKSNNKKR